MITALILAAGVSKRMGQPKILMPWGKTTVFGKIIETLKEARIENIVVVSGEIMEKLQAEYGADIRFIYNEDFANGEMLTSIQVGLMSVSTDQGAALIVLGDQPQILADTINIITDEYQKTNYPIIVPSYNMHRGHPWLVDRGYWDEILSLRPPETMRSFLNSKHEIIDYVTVTTPTILQDIDTREDYEQYRPSL
jgi:molybdenum cofactor cytidylyltransferase